MTLSREAPPEAAPPARRARAGLATLLALAACAGVAGPAAAVLPKLPSAPVALTPVVVRAEPGQLAAAEDAVADAGGTVTGALPVIGGLTASVPTGALAGLAAEDGVAAVAPDARISLAPLTAPLTAVLPTAETVDTATDAVLAPATEAVADALTDYDPATDPGAVPHVDRTVKADAAWRAGLTGKGVTVAVIDTGISSVEGLDSGNVVDGPDLSFDGQDPTRAHEDGFGHGTHMAGVIAGRDTAQADPAAYATAPGFTGIAPDARVLDVKVGAADGAVDVSQIIAAIGWVVENKQREGIGVLNLSFGTESQQSYLLDPVAYAAGVAWDAGIVVVAAAGNDGNTVKTLTNPAIHPAVIAVGASESGSTVDRADDGLAAFANRGTGTRHADLVAPGVGITSLRVPGSMLDEAHPAARRGVRFFRGSGTSQSAALVSGAAALVRQQHPEYTPDQVKAVLTRSAWRGVPGNVVAKGSGMLDMAAAVALPKISAATAAQRHPKATGTGSLEAARGGLHVTLDGAPLKGERDVTGAPWQGVRWNGTSWSGVRWNGTSWSGTRWNGTSWSGTSWSGVRWNGTSWSGTSWSGVRWNGTSWSGTSWSGTSWAGTRWN